jgi:5-formyltetrahydrofolate cyclo-ligase
MDKQKQKQLIRQDILDQRSRMAPEERQTAATAVAVVLRDFLERYLPRQTGRILQIAAYAAIRNELDLSQCWPLLLDWPATLYFPAVSAGGLVLGALPEDLQPESFLTPGHFGVPEPPEKSRLVEPPDLDMILVPGLAFDRQGNRLGWGKAYYDDLLPRLPQKTIRVGVACGFQVRAALPHEPHDQKVQAIVTPDGWFWCDID